MSIAIGFLDLIHVSHVHVYNHSIASYKNVTITLSYTISETPIFATRVEQAFLNIKDCA